MILSMVTISPGPEKRLAVLEILLSVKGPTLAEQGCLSCCIYEEHDEVHVITYMEKWQSTAEMSTSDLRSMSGSSRQWNFPAVNRNSVQ